MVAMCVFGVCVRVGGAECGDVVVLVWRLIVDRDRGG
jgi:hypothetical protein